ncbi:MAG: hypothetical protein KDB23_12935, partial [Planctomycetales bacterium]|nr:hypothetical protein [Planctomycetales bacterium]
MKLPKKGKAAKEAPAPEKKAKRKKSGGGGDAVAKAKDFVINHIEKVVLGGMALLALGLIYAGFSKEKIDVTPQTVNSMIQQARDTMTRQTWADVRASRIPEADKFDQTATLDTKQVMLDDYAWTQPLHPRLMERGKLRDDPELIAPLDLHVVGEYGPIAMRSADNASPTRITNPDDETSYPIPDKTASKMTVSRGGGSDYQGRYFVAITGLVPYKKQFDIYQEAFRDAAEYSAERDVPKYLWVVVERADVAADGTVGAWTQLDTIKAFGEEATWSQVDEEIADPDYLLTGARGLVMGIPPLALRDVASWAVHPSIPKVERLTGAGAGAVENRGGATTAGDLEGAAGGERSLWALGNAGGGNDRGGEDRGGNTGGDYASAQDLAQPAIPHENAMFRFLDFSVTPGKMYKYRARVALEDPNDPRDDSRPSDSSLET